MPRTIRTEDGLTKRQEKFCQNYVNGMNVAVAAKLAGYAGDAGNASRLANKPQIKARIEVLKEERATEFQRRREAQKHAITTEFANESERVSLKMLIMEARVNLDGARADGKWKDALDNLKFMAELTGFIGGTDKKPNRERPDDDDNTPPQTINVQVLNQFTERLDNDVGGELAALEAVAVPVIQNPVRVDRDDDPVEPAERGDGPPRQAD